MKCKKEQFVKGSCFHFYNRAVDNEKLFRDKRDYSQFLKKFVSIIPKYPVSVFAYCLMPNHFHFFLRQDSDIEIYKIFNSLLSYYVQKYNRRYDRKGRLLGGPLQSICVSDDRYFLGLCKYIHLNPVKAKLASNPEDWEFSNYSSWINNHENYLFCNDVYKIGNITSSEYKNFVARSSEDNDENGFEYILFDNKK